MLSGPARPVKPTPEPKATGSNPVSRARRGAGASNGFSTGFRPSSCPIAARATPQTEHGGPSHLAPSRPHPPERPSSHYRVLWADPLRKVFAIDVLECPACAGRLEIIAFIAGAAAKVRLGASVDDPRRDLGTLHAKLPPAAALRLDRVRERVFPASAAAFPGTAIRLDLSRLEGLGYYDRLALRIRLDAPAGPLGVIDGGVTRWTQNLLADRKERLHASAIGSELVCKLYAPSRLPLRPRPDRAHGTGSLPGALHVRVPGEPGRRLGRNGLPPQALLARGAGPQGPGGAGP